MMRITEAGGAGPGGRSFCARTEEIRAEEGRVHLRKLQHEV